LKQWSSKYTNCSKISKTHTFALAIILFLFLNFFLQRRFILSQISLQHPISMKQIRNAIILHNHCNITITTRNLTCTYGQNPSLKVKNRSYRPCLTFTDGHCTRKLCTPFCNGFLAVCRCALAVSRTFWLLATVLAVGTTQKAILRKILLPTVFPVTRSNHYFYNLFFILLYIQMNKLLKLLLLKYLID
jgi:hypothetical protein